MASRRRECGEKKRKLLFHFNHYLFIYLFIYLFELAFEWRAHQRVSQTDLAFWNQNASGCVTLMEWRQRGNVLSLRVVRLVCPCTRAHFVWWNGSGGGARNATSSYVENRGKRKFWLGTVRLQQHPRPLIVLPRENKKKWIDRFSFKCLTRQWSKCTVCCLPIFQKSRGITIFFV